MVATRASPPSVGQGDGRGTDGRGNRVEWILDACLRSTSCRTLPSSRPMPLDAGTKLRPCKIVAAIGASGAGEVSPRPPTIRSLSSFGRDHPKDRSPNMGLQRSWPSLSNRSSAGSRRGCLRAAQCCCHAAGHAAEAHCYSDDFIGTRRSFLEVSAARVWGPQVRTNFHCTLTVLWSKLCSFFLEENP